MNIFNAAEIIDIGIEKEKKRRDFYALVAETYQDKDMKDLFTKLKNWEEAHIKKFTEIRNTANQDLSATESFAGEFKIYMDSLVDNMLYKDISPKIFNDKVKSPLSAIQYGIMFEKDAILFFLELLPYMDAHNKEAVESLINEEKQHLIYLNELKQKIKN